MIGSERFDAATRPQVAAADPIAAAWVSANAGSGKTRVLTNRVARLLLNGTPPHRVLCLTFTKAAAANMQNRLVERLGEWSMLPDNLLRERLLDLGEQPESLDAAKLASARTLFAQALETPGGLKMQTIHAFSTTLLRRFPLEAGVSPQFSSIDDRAARRLRFEILEFMAHQHPDAFDAAARYCSAEDVENLVEEISTKRYSFDSRPTRQAIAAQFGLSPDAREPEIGNLLNDDNRQLLEQLMQVLRTSSSVRDQQALQKIERMNLLSPAADDVMILENVFLKGAGAKEPYSPKCDAFPTKDARIALSGNILRLNEFMVDVDRFRQQRIGAGAMQKAFALHDFAHPFLNEYARRKKISAQLDFNDLVFTTLRLIQSPASADWVLYRLDGGIDHILVDEAQDVNPMQWDIIAKLAEDFTSGQGAHSERKRTVFAVGDEKQSIYGFQGAAPEKFFEMQQHFGDRFNNARLPFRSCDMNYSFRSSQVILDLIDSVFASISAGREFDSGMAHRAFNASLPGRVDLWPFIESGEPTNEGIWESVEAGLSQMPPHVVLAQNIAGFCQSITSEPVSLPTKDGPRRVDPGDILILVQRRGDLFHSVIRELKIQGLPVAGTDRLSLTEELAVRDLSALISFLANPEDNLSLAAILRSPLFEISERQLYDLRKSSDQTLWAQLKAQAAEHPQTTHVLRDLLRRTGFLRPYDLIERMLTVHGGRERLTARLGREPEEAIDALLAQALDYETQEPPSALGFADWMQAESIDIKRQLDSAKGQIRVMTVHGAKGLESPIVIIPDSAERRARVDDRILTSADGVALWAVDKDRMPEVLAQAREKELAREKRERLRLLYVALTRAESWLVMCGAAKKRSADGFERGAWYDLVENGLENLRAEGRNCQQIAGVLPDGEEISRFCGGEWPAEGASIIGERQDDARLPDWMNVPVFSSPAPRKVLAPSDLGGAKIVRGSSDGVADAAIRGEAVHYLLEILPDIEAERRRSTGRTIAERAARGLGKDIAEEIVSECISLIENPGLSHVFAEDSLTETAICAELDALDGRSVFGIIDRLQIEPDRVSAIDFKTNTVVPEDETMIPDGIVRQMGAYRNMLATIYPGRKIEIAILWTRTGMLMQVSKAATDAALERARRHLLNTEAD